MSRDKYKMTDAAAKRIAEKLYADYQPGSTYIQIKDVEQALRDENFWGSHRANYISDLLKWMADNKYGHFALTLADRFIREYYEQVEGINEMQSGMRRLGILPYPEDDA